MNWNWKVFIRKKFDLKSGLIKMFQWIAVNYLYRINTHEASMLFSFKINLNIYKIYFSPTCLKVSVLKLFLLCREKCRREILYEIYSTKSKNEESVIRNNCDHE